MKKNSTDQLKVEGKMNERDSGIVGKMQAAALLVASVGGVVIGLITAIGLVF